MYQDVKARGDKQTLNSTMGLLHRQYMKVCLVLDTFPTFELGDDMSAIVTELPDLEKTVTPSDSR